MGRHSDICHDRIMWVADYLLRLMAGGYIVWDTFMNTQKAPLSATHYKGHRFSLHCSLTLTDIINDGSTQVRKTQIYVCVIVIPCVISVDIYCYMFIIGDMLWNILPKYDKMHFHLQFYGPTA